MKMFDLNCNLKHFASFLFENEQEEAKWGNGWFNGEPRGGAYPVPLAIRNREGSDLRSDVLPDFTHIGLHPIPTFSERAIECLGSMLDQCGEFAPIRMNEAVKYFAFNPTTVIDVLDESLSDVARFRDGRVMAVDRYVLYDSAISLPPIFKIPQTRRNTTYVNEDFVRRVQEEELTGFRFNLVFAR